MASKQGGKPRRAPVRTPPGGSAPTASTAARRILEEFYTPADTDLTATRPPDSDPGPAVNSSSSTEPDDAMQRLLDRIDPEVVAATFRFEPPADVGPDAGPLTLRITGRRRSVTGPRTGADELVHDQTVPGIRAGCGPVTVTAKIHDVNPGEWNLRARLLRPTGSASGAQRAQPEQLRIPVTSAVWSWRRWEASAGPDRPVHSRRAHLVHPPAVLLGSWAGLVALGVAVALVSQALVVSAADLRVDHAFAVSLLAVAVGVVGGKGWFVFQHRREHRREGWSVQGFVAGVVVSAAAALTLLHQSVGSFLDATAPALMLGMAVGRLGCFFTGCCAGRTTASRWGVWSSNRTIGARRVPTQLMESATALAVGLAALATILVSGPHRGTSFLATVAAYTFVRQQILALREEARQSRHGARVVSAASIGALVVALVLQAST